MTPEEIKNTDFETFFQAVPQMKEVHHIKATGQEIYHVYKNDVVYVTRPEGERTLQMLVPEVKPESGGNKMFGSAILGGGIVLVFGGLAAFALSKFRKKKEDGIVEEGLEFADDSYINEDEENAEDQQK